MIDEIKILSKIDSPYIIQIFETFEETDKHVFITPHFPTSLDNHIKNQGFLEPKDAMKLVIDIATALMELNMHGIRNIDLRPENIMIDANGEKIRPVKLICC